MIISLALIFFNVIAVENDTVCIVHSHELVSKVKGFNKGQVLRMKLFRDSEEISLGYDNSQIKELKNGHHSLVLNSRLMKFEEISTVMDKMISLWKLAVFEESDGKIKIVSASTRFKKWKSKRDGYFITSHLTTPGDIISFCEVSIKINNEKKYYISIKLITSSKK